MASTYNKNIKINLDYGTFEGGITECNRKMDMLTQQFKLQQAQMGNNASETDQLALKEDLLNQKIQLQQQVVDQVRQKFTGLQNDTNATTKALDSAEKAVIKQETALQRMKNELTETGTQLKKATEETKNMGESMSDVGQSSETLGQKISTVTSNIVAFSAAIKETAGAAYELGTSAAAYADDILTMSSTTGFATDTLQAFDYVAEITDVSMETINTAITKMTRNMGEAADGSQTASEKFEKLGLSIKDSSGHLKDSEKMFYEAIDALGQIENQTERDAIAMDLFGKSARELNPLIEQGSVYIKELTEKARDMGFILSDDVLNSLGDADNAIREFNSTIYHARTALGVTLVPAIQTVLEIITDLPQPVLMAGIAFSTLIKAGQTLVPVITMLNTAHMASATATMTATAAEGQKVAMDGAATVSTMGLNAALLPQIAIAAGLTAAFAILAYAIYKMVSAFTDEAEAADKAANSTSNLLSIAGSSTYSSMQAAAGATRYMAQGSKLRGAGGPTWVGEQGAELLDLPAGSTVYSSQDSRQMSSASNTYNITIDAKNVDDFTKVVKVFNGLPQAMNRGNPVNG